MASTLGTLNDLFFGAMDRFRDRPAAMRYKVDGRWQAISYAALLERVHAASAGLLDLGIRAGDRVAILSENRPEWAISDYACLAARCADVPVYPTLPAKQIEYILRDSGAVAIFVSTRAQLEKRVSPHLLRHSYASHLVEAGADLRTVQLLLGHVKLEHTIVYLHLSQRHLQAVANPLDAMPVSGIDTVRRTRRLHKR